MSDILVFISAYKEKENISYLIDVIFKNFKLIYLIFKN